MDEDVRMDEDDVKQEMYDNIDIIRELTFGIDENKFATKFNERLHTSRFFVYIIFEIGMAKYLS